ncbi:MAG: sigma 54-interacting transcriptional regulator [Planctomycetes bacterium]|nr:sigma 54-interacting transcriptional regulator [Planctomycetota bacterium]
MPGPGPFQLVVHQGEEREAHDFDREVVVLGRSRECDLVLGDRLVSRRHCRVERRPTGFVLFDEGAQNPPRLRGMPVKEAELRPGDRFAVGGCEIELVVHQERPSLDDTQLVEDRQTARDLSEFIEVAQALNEERDLSRLLTRIVDAAIHLSGAERGFLIVGHGEAETVEVARNFAQEEVNTPEFKISRTIAQRVRESGVAELTTNAQEDARFRGLASVADLRLRSVLCIPLRIRGKVEGVLYVDNRLQNHVFEEREKRLLISLADHASVAISNARTMRELDGNRLELERALHRISQLNAQLEGRLQEQAATIDDMRQQLDETKKGLEFAHDYRAIVGNSRRMHEVFRLLDKYIPAEDPVLILGESGTGKELVARAIHKLGPRAAGPFVSENCAALPEALLESELFGYEKGAFTGATSARKGLLVAASGGVLLLDEVGEMHVDLQKKLLRVLQEGEVRPIGSRETIKVDVRLVTATNKNLEEMVRDGEFREDLYYRLAVLPIRLPPLREHREDIPALVERILGELARESQSKRVRVSKPAMDLLVAYRWPGNVRELQNEVRRAAILGDGVIEPQHLGDQVRTPRVVIDPIEDAPGVVPAERGTTLPDMVKELEVREIQKAILLSGGNKSRTAEMLGLSRFALQRKLEKYELESGAPPAGAAPGTVAPSTGAPSSDDA